MTATSVTPYDSQFASAGVANNVDPDLLAAMSAVESGYNPGAVSPKGATGLLQLMPGTSKGLGVSDPTDPGQNVMGGAKYFAQMLDKFGNVPQALMGYNAGPNGNFNNPETQSFVAKVQSAYQDIKRAGGIQYAQADTGTATDANTGTAPVSGRPSDDALMQMMTGSTPSSSQPGTAPTSSGAAAADQAAAGRPSDADLIKALTSSGSTSAPVPAVPQAPSAATAPSAPAAAPSAMPAATTPQPQYPVVPVHPAPDGSGGMTNLSDSDYFRMMGTAAPTASGPQAPASSPIQVTAATQPPANTPSAQNSLAGKDPDANSSFLGALLAGGTDAYRGVARTLANGANWVDQRVPFLASLDNSVGLDPQQTSSGLMADIQANQQKYGSSPGYLAGNIGGNVLATLPLMAAGGAGVGAVGDALGSAFPGISNALVGAANGVRAVPGGNLLLSAGSNALKGAAQGAGAAAETSGGSDQPFAQQVQQGAELGGAAGVAIPALGSAGRSIVRAVLGGSTDTATAALAAQAQRYGIPISLGQLSDNASVRALDSMSKRVPFSGSDGQATTQQTAFNRAVGGTLGSPVDKITPQVMTAAKQRIGAVMTRIENSNPVTLDQPFLNQVAGIENNARLSLPDSEYKVVSRQLDNILTNLLPGDKITGQTYGNLIHKGSPLDAALSSRDSNIANYAGQIRSALQDALTRSLSQADAAAYTQARYQYKNLKTIEGLAEKSTTGDISPAGLMQAVRSSYGDMAYDQGGGDLGNLARIGQRFLKEPPDSGTAGRLSALEAMTRAGGTIGGILTGVTHPGDAAALAATGAGTIGAARLARGYLGSRGLANRLIQNGLNSNAPSPVADALIGASTALGPTTAAVAGNRLLETRQRELQRR